MKNSILSLSLLLAVGLTSVNSVSAQVSIGISVHIAPPAIPVYEQPPCPTEGYIWIPGYWAYGDDGYFWVPGYWEAPPQTGYYWTPGYWGYVGNIYRWNAGYWGPHVGYYGGINYGCGYGGSGYYGGEWYGGRFRYNTAVTRVNTTVVRNVYVNRTVVRNVTVNRVSYNGGPGGVSYRASAREQEAARDRHIERTEEQHQHQQAAMHDRNQFASVNHGRPGNAAVVRPAAYRPAPAATRPESRPAARPAPAVTRPVSRPAPRPEMNRPAPHANPGRPAPRPQMTRPQPQQRPQMTRPQPQMSRPAPQPRPQQPQQHPQGPPRGGGQPGQQPHPQGQPRGGGGEHHGGGEEHHH